MRAASLYGMVFGELTVLNRCTNNSKDGKARWSCLCSCGNYTKVVSASLTKGVTKSCGCKRVGRRSSRKLTHDYPARDKFLRTRYTKKLNNLKATYNIDEQAYRDMMDSAKGCCEICGNSFVNPIFSKHDTHVDHDHSTGLVRGLLCKHCNVSLGAFKESVDNLSAAIKYLHKYTGDANGMGKQVQEVSKEHNQVAPVQEQVRT